MIPAPFRVVLDANVLFPLTLRDTFLRAAEAGLYQLYWSEEILEETRRNLVRTARMTEDQAARLVRAMRAAFPEALVSGYEPLIASMTNDADDRHVAAGTTPEMIELFATLHNYARAPLSMLIQGETGTGKERVAQAIHAASPRRDKDYLIVNCAELPETLLDAELFGHVRGAFTGADRARDGLFVEADGVTLLFDEVGEMSAAMQAKLLRVLESGEVRPLGTGRTRNVDVRTLFATNVDLRHAMNQGRFREDLYYRLATVTVEIPPLRRRLSDLPILVHDILEQLGRPQMIVDEAGMLALRAHSWPGNVRELRSIVQVALVESAGDRLMPEKALARTKVGASPERTLGLYDDERREFDRGYYTTLYVRFGGNLSKIAKKAGKQRVTVRATLRALGLSGDGGATEKET